MITQNVLKMALNKLMPKMIVAVGVVVVPIVTIFTGSNNKKENKKHDDD